MSCYVIQQPIYGHEITCTSFVLVLVLDQSEHNKYSRRFWPLSYQNISGMEADTDKFEQMFATWHHICLSTLRIWEIYPSEVTVVSPTMRRPYYTLFISYEYYFSATFYRKSSPNVVTTFHIKNLSVIVYLKLTQVKNYFLFWIICLVSDRMCDCISTPT